MDCPLHSGLHWLCLTDYKRSALLQPGVLMDVQQPDVTPLGLHEAESPSSDWAATCNVQIPLPERKGDERIRPDETHRPPQRLPHVCVRSTSTVNITIFYHHRENPSAQNPVPLSRESSLLRFALKLGRNCLGDLLEMQESHVPQHGTPV